MALNNSVLVDIPEHGIAYKKVSGKTYPLRIIPADSMH